MKKILSLAGMCAIFAVFAILVLFRLYNSQSEEVEQTVGSVQYEYRLKEEGVSQTIQELERLAEQNASSTNWESRKIAVSLYVLLGAILADDMDSLNEHLIEYASDVTSRMEDPDQMKEWKELYFHEAAHKAADEYARAIHRVVIQSTQETAPAE